MLCANTVAKRQDELAVILFMIKSLDHYSIEFLDKALQQKH